jgi:hypothetical protein
MNVKEMGLESVDEVNLTRNRDNWRAVVNTITLNAEVRVLICRRSSSFGIGTHFLCTALKPLS